MESPPINLSRIVVLLLMSVVILFSCNNSNRDTVSENIYFPNETWDTALPESVGMDTEKLNLLDSYCAAGRNTRSYMVIKDGYIVKEAYLDATDATTLFESFSIAKSIISALTGIAIENDYIHTLDDVLGDYYPQLENNDIDPLKQTISIRHLLTMTTGLMWNESEQLLSTNNDIYNLKLNADNYVDYVLNKPLVSLPGVLWNYCSGSVILLSDIIEKKSEKSLSEFAGAEIFSPLNIAPPYWQTDPSGHTIGAWGLALSTQAYARFGYLYLQNGRWKDRQLISEDWIAQSLSSAGEDTPHFGFLWWRAQRYPDAAGINIPADTYMSVGLFQRYIIIIPSCNLLLVRMGDGLETGENGWDTVRFISMAVNAIK